MTMQRLLLPLLLLSALVVNASSSSLLWPAAQHERYDTAANIVRTVVPGSAAWRFDNDLIPKRAARVHRLLQKAQARFLQALQKKVPPKKARTATPSEDNAHGEAKAATQGKVPWPLMGLRVSIDNCTIDTLYHGVNESYVLEVRPVIDNDPLALLSAGTVYGILHGLQSLLQLLQYDSDLSPASGPPVFVITAAGQAEEGVVLPASLEIRDAPAYAFRGLLVDSSRHYLPLDLLLQNLDAMAMNKLNVMHWHLVDSNAWPYVSTTFPELSRIGAYCDQCVYAPQDVRRVISYAADRGIRVVPEFDMPGHCRALGWSHPELLTENCTVGGDAPLNVTGTAVYDFVKQFYNEVTAVFPDGMLHVGGDEVNTACWEQSPAIHQWMANQNMTSVAEVQAYFEDFAFAYLVNHPHTPKTPVAWQEVADGNALPRRFQPYRNHDVVIDIWKEGTRQQVLRNLTAQGFRAVVSSCWYLDHLNDNVDDLYQCDIGDFVSSSLADDLDPSSSALLVGGHASMWGEWVDETVFFPRVWPRTSAVAERLWTGRAAADYRERLKRFRCDMVQQGIPASPIGPGPPCGGSETVQQSVVPPGAAATAAG